MSTTYQITSDQITDFIALVLLCCEDNLASDIKYLLEKSNPGYRDYEFLRDSLCTDSRRSHNQLRGLRLLFSSCPAIVEELTVAIEKVKQLYDKYFQEAQDLQFPAKVVSVDESSPSSLAVPPETLDDSTVETADALDQGTNSLGSRYISYSDDEPFPLIFESSKLLYNVIDNSLDSIPEGGYKERCRELSIAVSLVFHFHMDRFGDACRHPAQSSEALIQGVNQ